MYGKGDSLNMKQQSSSSPQSEFHLSEALGVFADLPGSDESNSSDSSLDFESSFYRFKSEDKSRPRPSEPSSEMEEIGELLGSIAKPALKPTIIQSPKFNRFSFGTQIREELSGKEEEDKTSL
jgi:hypothetical protein